VHAAEERREWRHVWLSLGFLQLPPHLVCTRSLFFFKIRLHRHSSVHPLVEAVFG
jgi:hypothetical protein